MNATSIIEELDKLSTEEKLFVVEQTIKSIRGKKPTDLSAAADALCEDYKNDNELTIFTQIDAEPFYETR